MQKWNRHPHLRLVVDNREPRKYAQSTSGRVSSTGTAPELSRSSEMANDSRMRSLVESTLRRYPTDVPQRLAKPSCTSVSSELRYVRSDSMPRSLPLGNILSIPDGQLPRGKDLYNGRMDKDQIRTANFLRILREQYRNSPKAFEIATGYSANMVSQIKTGKKVVGEDRAVTLEKAMKLETGTLERPNAADIASPRSTQPRVSWPLSVPLADFEALNPRLQRELDEAFTRMVVGAQSQDLLSKQKTRRRG